MLTFEFTGVDGKMTAGETLTSGMVGKKTAITLDSSWDSLSAFVVFRAGEVCKTAPLEESTAIIPAEVLAHPFCRLHVGVYGTDAEGTLVIPTVMAEGPYIRYGADPTEDSTAENLPVWQNLQNQIGDLAQLETEDKDSLVAAINSLMESTTGTGFTQETAALLISILRHALFDCNQSANIDTLSGMLLPDGGESDSGDCGGGLNSGAGGGSNGSGSETEPRVYTVTYLLTNTVSGNTAGSIGENAAYTTTLTAPDGYEISSVTVTMGGKDITSWAYSGGVVNIVSVTGDVVITATGTKDSVEVTYFTVAYGLEHVVSSNSAVSVEANAAYSTSLTVENGYDLVSVSVTMGDIDITDLAYAHGAVTIGAVTGDVVIQASAVVHTTQSETLDIVHTVSYPNVTTFAYTEGASWRYVVVTQGSIQGGLVSIDYDPEIYNNFDLNFYVFDAEGNPYKQTDGNTVWPTDTPQWEGVGEGVGFGYISTPFTFQMEEGCTFIVCMRNNVRTTGTGTAGSVSNDDFVAWALSGGITITVTK